MAVSRREKETDPNYSVALGYLQEESLENSEPMIEHVISDLRDDVNDLSDLANKVDGLTFEYTPKSGNTKAKLTITVADGTKLTLKA